MISGRKYIIENQIKLCAEKILLIWARTHSIRPDFIATVVGKFDFKVVIQERWSPVFPSKRCSAFGDIVANFGKKTLAKEAAKELSILSK